MDIRGDIVDLTRALCDVPSVSGDETTLADLVERALRPLEHLQVLRDGDAIVARTNLGRSERAVLAGHLDTVPIAGNLPCTLHGEGDDAVLAGRGTVDMKGGVAVQLRLAARLTRPVRDLTFVFYDHEEVAAELNGLGRLVARHPDWLQGDVAVLLEPTAGLVEGGCNGTLRVEVVTRGVAAHSARAWMGRNAVHAAAEVLTRLDRYVPRSVDVDGLVFREGLNAVAVRGGIAGNVIPDECVVTVNYRFAPSLSVEEAEQHVRSVLDGFEVRVTDAAPGARPGLDAAPAQSLAALTGRPALPKYGWTDVARFSALGVPAVNFGPGDPLLAHKDDERVPVAQLAQCEELLARWLQG